MADQQTMNGNIEDHVSAAFRLENVAVNGGQEELRNIVAAGPRGALALAGLSVAVLLALWGAFFLFVFLPRGAIG